ncbi:uncharacterized protein LOC132738094 [Ruditapes philippinarum]|uniref:uncharacterized protein LOC132738094 n=1 Tax=Ruditapes philippinarum TaxID=129788 RepID=UPI00295B49D0|nr:uncharacterized protein LOC132738094 [Ruditapes philippinarum]
MSDIPSQDQLNTQQDLFDSEQDLFDSQQPEQDLFDSQQLEESFDSQHSLFDTDSSPNRTFTDPPSPIFPKRRRIAHVDVTSSQASTVPPEDVVSSDSQTSTVSSDTVPSFPAWFNIIYDGDAAIYTYHHLDSDIDSADLQILI